MMKKIPSADERKDPSLFGGQRAQAGTVYLVGGGPGDPGLLTLRGAELLASADAVLHDELIHPALLELCDVSADVRSVGKRGADRESKQAKQDAIEAELLRLAREGKSVVRLKGGDPFLFGRGSEEAEALAAEGIPFEIVPGVPSPLGATAYAGFSLTHRDLASSVIVVSGTTRKGGLFDFSEIASVKGTIVVLMGMHVLEDVVRGLLGEGKRTPETPAAIVQWGTRAEQRVVTGRLDEIAALARQAGLGSPGVILVGEVLSLRKKLRWFDERPLFGKRVLILRPRAQSGGVAKLVLRRGGEVMSWPAIEIGPPPEPERVEEMVGRLGEYDVVVFTSENGVERLFDAIGRRGLDARAFGSAKVAAIGTGTAAALLERGIRADILPTEFHGEGLARAILESPVVRNGLSKNTNPRVLIARALVAREALPELLREAGCEVLVLPVYETTKAGPERASELVAALEAKRIDVVLLSATSTVEGLAAALGERKAELLSGVIVASIGDITTESARKKGIDVAVTARTSTMEGLIQAVEAFLSAK